VWNADQTGLYYRKLPDRIYVDKDRKNSVRGVKAMKDKSRITIMVCISAEGEKAPLSVVGKPVSPECFRLLNNRNKPPLAYTHQGNAWFDREVTVWWINHVFWPHAKRVHGEVQVVLLLDNCPAHVGIDPKKLPSLVKLIFFPPNLTSRHQPADMGIIAALKVGYKTSVLRYLLSICDDEETWKNNKEAAKLQQRGCTGISYGEPAHILDAMEILGGVWNNADKYVTSDCICRCWRKADCLPAAMTADLARDYGSARPKKNAKLDSADLDELCDVMMKLSAHEASQNVCSLQKSFAVETRDDGEQWSPEQIADMAQTWVDIESDIDVINCEIDEHLAALDAGAEESSDSDGEGTEAPPTPTRSPEPIINFQMAMGAMKVVTSYCLSSGIDNLKYHAAGLDRVIRQQHLTRTCSTSTQGSLGKFAVKSTPIAHALPPPSESDHAVDLTTERDADSHRKPGTLSLSSFFAKKNK